MKFPKRKILMVLALLLLGISCSADLKIIELPAQERIDGKLYGFYVQKNGIRFTENAFVFIPSNALGKKSLPAVLLMHGGGTATASMTGMLDSGKLGEYLNRDGMLPFALVWPPLTADVKDYWSVTKTAVWPYLKKRFALDLDGSRNAVGGFSGGAPWAAWTAGRERKRFAWFYLVAGALSARDFSGWALAGNKSLKGFPRIFLAMGIRDPILPQHKELVEFLNAKGVCVTEEIENSGHDSATVTAGMKSLFDLMSRN